MTRQFNLTGNGYSLVRGISVIMVLMYFGSSVYAQTTLTVQGTIMDSNSEPLIGATVLVKGTQNGTSTGFNGEFTLENVSEDAILVISYVGYTSLEVPVNGESILSIVLASDSQLLDEIVVVAYGAVKKSDFTGSAVTMSAKDLDKRPISNPLVALQGSGPGVQTTAPSGSPGSSPGIRVRGIGSYSSSNNALIIVDGVEYTGGMSNINPDDVESITVLKDAATIALYGSRGANGVVMITTKKGGEGNSRLEFKYQTGFNKNGIPAYNTVGPEEYYELMWEAYKNALHYGSQDVPQDVAAQIASGVLPRNAKGEQMFDGNTYLDIVQYLGNYNAYNVANDQLISTDGQINPSARLKYEDDLNWIDQASQTGKRDEYGLTYSHGMRNTDFYASLNYLSEEGWGLNSSMDRFSGRINVNSQVTDWVKAGGNFFINHSMFNNANSGSGIVNPFYFSRSIAPIYPVFLHDPTSGEYVLDELGNRIYDYGNFTADYNLSRPFNSGRHSIAENLWNIDRTTRDFIGGRTYIDLTILPWLTLSSTFSADLTNHRNEDYQNTIVGDGAPSGRYNQAWNRRLSYTFNQMVRMEHSFLRHNIKFLAGHENFDNSYESISGRRTGEGFSDFLVYSNFADILSLSSGLSENAMESYFTRLNYDFDNKYYISGSFRYDGDSRFPEVNRWAPFWSVGLAWRLENEDFFNKDWVDLLKLRGSYGRLGNNSVLSGGSIDNYPFQPGYEINNNNASATGVVLGGLGSPDLRWEGQKPLDVGVDFALFNNRISGSIDYFNRVSDGLLFNVQQPYHNGGTTGGSFTIQKNVGDMRNTGLELSLTGNIVRKQNFNWHLTFNISTINNEILKMPEETPEIVSSPYKRAEGRSIYDYYTRHFYGVDPDNGRVMYLGVEEFDPDNAEEIKFINNPSGGVDTVTYNQNLARQDWVGKSALAKAYGSIINNFSYKNFDFGFVVLYSLGGWGYDGQYGGFMSAGPDNGANLHRDLLNGWRKPGDVTDIPRMDINQRSAFGATSTRFLTKKDYIAINSVNVSYRLPESLLSRFNIEGIRLFVSGENLYLFTHRQGMNPVSNFAGISDTDSYSPARTFNFGINLSF